MHTYDQYSMSGLMDAALSKSSLGSRWSKQRENSDELPSLSVAVASSLLPVLEGVFGITTDVRLLELSNQNLPLLKRLHKNRIEKLLIVGDDGSLKGLITVKDIQKKIDYPNRATDERGRLLVGDALIAAGILTAISGHPAFRKTAAEARRGSSLA